MSLFYLFIEGVLIGTAMVIPGLSGSVIAVILGIYDRMIYSLSNLFKDFKSNFSFLFILSLGVLFGAIWFSNIISVFYIKYEVITKMTFMGLVLGGVPFLLKKSKGKNSNYIIILSSFLISFSLWYVSKNIFDASLFNNNGFIVLFLTGIIYSIGKVIPGISSSFLLILIGKYEFVLNIIAHPITYGIKNIILLIPFVCGLVIGVLVLLRVITYLLVKHESKMYSMITGFVIGSLFAIIPNLSASYDLLIGIILLILSFLLSYKLTCR